MNLSGAFSSGSLLWQIRRMAWRYSLVSLPLSIPAWDGGLFFGILIGAALGLLNFHVIALILDKADNPDDPKGQTYLFLAAVKFVALITIVYLVVRSGVFSPMGFAIGLGNLPFGILAGAVIHYRLNDTDKSHS